MGFFETRAMELMFLQMEIRINRFLHIRQTDFIRGYFAIWVPSLLIAFLIWCLLRTFARTRVTQEFLRSVAGVITIFAPAAYWFYVYERTFWPVGWPYHGAPFELAIALVITVLFLRGKLRVPFWASVLLIGGHYAYWYYATEWVPFATNYASPAGPILGFCSAMGWVLYVSWTNGSRALNVSLISWGWLVLQS
jgi:hypothetical protein